MFYEFLNPRLYTPVLLELCLSSTRSADAAAVLNNSCSSQKLRGNPNLGAIITCLFRHGLDVNTNNGELLSFAIKEDSVQLLEKMLAENPSIASLTAAFRTAISLWPVNRLHSMALLLQKSDKADIS